jgi:uncharacterized OB-fold protein
MENGRFNDITYQQFLNQGRLMGCRCKACGARHLPPRPICMKCYRSDMEWGEREAKGKLAAFTCTSMVPPSMTAEGYDRDHPYCSGVVDLDDGGRVVARIEGVDAGQPETIAVGIPVTMTIVHRAQGRTQETVLAFRPL